jgi:hypothetical protein
LFNSAIVFQIEWRETKTPPECVIRLDLNAGLAIGLPNYAVGGMHCFRQHSPLTIAPIQVQGDIDGRPQLGFKWPSARFDFG